MERWIGCAAVCVNERNEVLMVLQGQKGEEKKVVRPKWRT